MPRVAEMHLAGPATVQVLPVRAEGGDLDPLAALADEHHAELRADLSGVAKEGADALGRSVGGDVVWICGRANENDPPATVVAADGGGPSAAGTTVEAKYLPSNCRA